jgi:opacity protein-like surface antigen
MRRIFISIALAAFINALPAFAQGSRFTVNFGVGMGFNQGRTANFADTSGNIVAGVGYNISESVSAIAEYQYYNLDIKSTDINQATGNTNIGQLDSVTGNVLVRIPNRAGVYGIGGVGWYRRFARIEGPSIVPAFVADPALGYNVGAGLTFPFGGRFKMYGEVRYHHAYNRAVPTQVLPVTFGFRW